MYERGVLGRSDQDLNRTKRTKNEAEITKRAPNDFNHMHPYSIQLYKMDIVSSNRKIFSQLEYI